MWSMINKINRQIDKQPNKVASLIAFSWEGKVTRGNLWKTHGFKFSTLLYKAFKCITLDEDSSDSLTNIYKMTENLKVVEKWLSSINA